MRVSRLVLAVIVFSGALTPAFSPAPAAAQAAGSSNPCTGTVNIVRVSEIKPGMMDTFLKAVAAQAAWYKNAGLPDQIGVMRVMDQDPTTKAYTLSETQALTTHSSPAAGGGKRPPNDAAWDAFVKMFADSSTIKTQYLTCMSM
jgi:hypothetical protein